ncbi:SDR family oxidoreductase [Angustibacter aerolatus]
MRVFVTGASGWIGSASVEQLLAAGHQVEGLARSGASAERLVTAGASVRRGDLDDLDGLRAGAAAADAVLHLANKHDFTDPVGTNRAERQAVETLLDELEGSDRPLLLASGAAGLASGRLATEDDRSPFDGPTAMRGGTENLTLSYADRGVRSIALRFAPTVHGTGDHGFVSVLVDVARRQGVSAYVGDGANRWAAVHRSDAARLVALALDVAPAGSRLHVVAEEGIPTREVAEAIGAGLGLPVRSVAPDAAGEHFGWIGGFFGMDLGASSEHTRKLLGWTPTGPTLVEDLRGGAYFPV